MSKSITFNERFLGVHKSIGGLLGDGSPDEYVGARLAAENGFATDVDEEQFLDAMAAATRGLVKKTGEHILAIGRILYEVKEVVGESRYGGKAAGSGWKGWCARAGISSSSANHFVQVYRVYGFRPDTFPVADILGAGLAVLLELTNQNNNPDDVAKVEAAIIMGKKLNHKEVRAALAPTRLATMNSQNTSAANIAAANTNAFKAAVSHIHKLVPYVEQRASAATKPQDKLTLANAARETAQRLLEIANDMEEQAGASAPRKLKAA
jgi:hypothetical protein